MNTAAGDWYLVDGVEGPAPTAPFDSPWARWGDGVYDTLRVDAGRALDVDLHLDRLANSLAACALPGPSRAVLTARLEQAMQAVAPLPHARVRTVVAMLDATRCTHVVQAGPWSPPDHAEYRKGRTVMVSDVPHPQLGHLGKSLSYQCFRIAARQASQRAAHDALLLAQGHVRETTTAAIVWRVGQRWFRVHDGAGVLPSTTRAGLERRGWAFEPTESRLDALLDADAVVLLSGLQLAAGVRQLGERVWEQPDADAMRMRALLVGGSAA